MPPKSKDGRARLGEPLASQLAAFRVAAGLGATEVGVIREAVHELIQSRIKKDRALKKKYLAELAKLQPPPSPARLRVVK
jgi:hypothetical protein